MQTLRLFCDVASRRSFSQAAARHGITQSAASQRVSQLEKRLSVTLLDRSVRPLRPTPAGQLFMNECLSLLEQYDRLERRVMGMDQTTGDSTAHDDQPAGEVTVAAIYSAGIDLLNNVRATVQERYPNVHVTLDYKQPRQVHDAVRARECDLGIASYPARWRDVSSIALWQEPMGVICSPSHRLASQTSVTVEDLADCRLAMFEDNLPAGRAIGRYLRDHGVRANVANVFDNIDTIKSAVAVTDEIAILPRRTVRREVGSGTLRLLELSPALDRPMGLIYRPPRKPRSRNNGNGNGHATPPVFTPAVQAFVDCLIAYDGPDVLPVAASNDNTQQTPTTPTHVGDHA